MVERVSRYNWFVYEWRYSSLLAASVVLVFLTVFYFLSGSFTTEQAPWYFRSYRAFQGMILVMILIPTYIAFCSIVGVRRSLELATIIDTKNNTRISSTVKTVPLRFVAATGSIGFLFAVSFNIPGYGLNLFEADSVERSLILGQMLVWILVGFFLALRIRVARAFRHASEQVEIDIFEPTPLKPFAQIGLVDVLVITGALLITTLQSFDLSFRPDNYSNTLIVVIPSMVYLVIYPMYGIHKRMVQMRQGELESINRIIATAPKDLDLDNVSALEILLQRRERIEKTSTWPIDTSTMQRFLFYIVIPPLAWVGSALVEFVIDAAIQS